MKISNRNAAIKLHNTQLLSGLHTESIIKAIGRLTTSFLVSAPTLQCLNSYNSIFLSREVYDAKDLWNTSARNQISTDSAC